MPIDRKRLDTILLELRVSMLEMMMLRLSVFMRASGLTTVRESAVRSALQGAQLELKVIAQALEKGAYEIPAMQLLTLDERALFADEFREMVEQMKTRLRELYPGI